MPATEITPRSHNSALRQIVGAIPARFASTRLPGKPLRPLAGRPLIEHVYRRASEARELDRVVVLTDDPRIAETVEGFGGQVELTPEDCASGSDRVAFAARNWEVSGVVNIQGDEPLIDPQAIDLVAAHLREHADAPIVTLAAPASQDERCNPEVVKVVVGLDDTALYFSRSAIPHLRHDDDQATALRHIGIYGYQRAALLELAEMPVSPLEQCESLEQLRALENGMMIKVLRVSHAWQGVDTMEDLELVERILRQADSASL